MSINLERQLESMVYSLNIFSQKEQCLATYKYNAASKPPKWELHLEELGEGSLQVGR